MIKKEYDNHQLHTMENKYSEKIRESINVNMTEDDLLKKCDPNNYSDFTGALCLVFDMDPELLYALVNMDQLCIPKSTFITTGDAYEYKRIVYEHQCNNIQWLTQPVCRDPIDEVLACLYRSRDIYYGEPYDFDDRELELKKGHFKKIEEKYNGLRNYLEIVSSRLWHDRDFLATNYSYVFNSEKVKHLI